MARIVAAFAFLAVAGTTLPAQAPPVQITPTPVAAGDWAHLTTRFAVHVAWADGGTVRLRRSLDQGSTWEPEQVLYQGAPCSELCVAGDVATGGIAVAWRAASSTGDDIVATWSPSGASGTWTAPAPTNLRTGGVRRLPRVALTPISGATSMWLQLAWCEDGGDVYWQRRHTGSPPTAEVRVHAGSHVGELALTADWLVSLLPFGARTHGLVAWRDGAGAAASIGSVTCLDVESASPTFIATNHAAGRVDGVQVRAGRNVFALGQPATLELFVVWRSRHGAAGAVLVDATTAGLAATLPAWERGTMPLPSTSAPGRPDTALVPATASLGGPVPSELLLVTEQNGVIVLGRGRRAPTLVFSPPTMLSAMGVVASGPVLDADDSAAFAAWRQWGSGSDRLVFTRSFDRGATWNAPSHTATAATTFAAGTAARAYAVDGTRGAGAATAGWLIGRGAHMQPGIWLQTMLGVQTNGSPTGPSQPTLTHTFGEPVPGESMHFELAAQVASVTSSCWLFSFTSPGPVDLGLALPACAGALLHVGGPVVPAADVYGGGAIDTWLPLPATTAMFGAQIHMTAVIWQPTQPCPFDVANGLSIYVN